jgi:hypothetical protein
MTLEDVKKAVEKIKEKRRDDEAAHSLEDELYLDLLQSIADGNCDDPQACAAEAIKTQDLNFARWTA